MLNSQSICLKVIVLFSFVCSPLCVHGDSSSQSFGYVETENEIRSEVVSKSGLVG